MASTNSSPSKQNKSSHSAIIPADQLNADLWFEILNGFPPIVLCRNRLVCKSWNYVISSSTFITNHHLSSNPTNSPLLLFSTCSSSYAFYNPQEDFPLIQNPLFHPLPFPANRFKIIGVIHGVVCLSRDSVRSTILWNPTIHKSIEIPHSSAIRNVGFGFDASKIDFKVVRINWGPQKPRFEVFSPREGQWRSVIADHIGPFSLETDKSCFENGAIHWIIRRRRVEVLMFDCESEELKTMELPQEFNPRRGIVKPCNLFMYFGMLSVWAVMSTMGKEEMGVWVMEEYGVVGSWKKMTKYRDDFVLIGEGGVLQLMPTGRKRKDTSMTFRQTGKGFKRSQQLWNGHVFKPSMLLMDTKSQTGVGKVYYVK